MATRRIRTASARHPVTEQLVAQFRSRIPRNDDVVRQALREILAPFLGDVEAIRDNVSRVIVDAEHLAHQKYTDAQGPAQASAIRAVFRDMLPPPATGAEAIECIAQHVAALDAFFLSVAQGRKARAGTAVETFFDTLFRAMGFPFEREHVVNGTPDFVFPSAAHFRKLPTDCIVFTSKRTLRERWRQITTEGARGAVLFLGTLDATVKANDLEEIRNQKIVIVVPESIRAAAYPDAPHVLSVERFIRDHLEPALERWKRNGVCVAIGQD